MHHKTLHVSTNNFLIKIAVFSDNFGIVLYSWQVFNVWLNRSQLDSHICFHIYLLWYAVVVESPPLHRCVIRKERCILIPFLENLNILLWNHAKIHCKVVSQRLVPMANLKPFSSLRFGHLESIGSLSYANFTNVPRFNYTTSKSHIY